MPTSCELIIMQKEFEAPRGLDKFNSPKYSMSRIQNEVDEAVEALNEGDTRALAVELVDVIIFAHSLLGKLADELGLQPEDIDQLVEAKMAHNHEKYNEAFFNNGHDTATAITLARHWHNLGLDEERLTNDYF